MRRDLRGLLVVGAVGVVLCAAIAAVQGRGESTTQALSGASPVAAAAPAGLSADPTGSTVDPASAPTNIVDTDSGGAATNPAGCTMTERSVAYGDSNSSVLCIQEALVKLGLLDGAPSGTYDNTTVAAVKQLQTTHDLFVDGMAGRETALQLGIWPDEASLVVHTPPPAPGAKDSMGFKLSPVATTGADAPPLPENSGSGRRLVYSRAGQRIWAVGADGTIIRSWLVSGSKYGNEQTGVHKVFSRSDTTTAWNGRAILPLMVRWLPTKLGAIGFHGIPIHVADGSPYQTDAELGTRLSGGCQRQDNMDAQFTWAFAQIGTPVVVI